MLPSLATADAYWAKDFGLAPSALRPASTWVQVHSGRLKDTPRIWMFACGVAPLVSLPPRAFALLGTGARGWSIDDVTDPVRLLGLLGPLGEGAVQSIIGPAFIGYGAHGLDLRDAKRARVLDASHAEQVARLRKACTEAVWLHGGPSADAAAYFGSMHGSGRLAALASYVLWDGVIAHISIVTHPDYRGAGHGAAAVALAAQHALQNGRLPQYRTLRSNQPSLRIASRLGFEEYGVSTLVRLNPPA